MKYGIYTAYWEKEWPADWKKYIAKVADLGFDSLEIACGGFQQPEYSTDDQLKAIRDFAGEKGISLTAGYGPQAHQNLASPDPAVRQQGIQFWKETLRKLNLMDIHVVGGGLYHYWPVNFREPFDKAADLDRSIESMKIVSRMAEEQDVVMGMEVLNRFEGYLLNTCEECLAYVNAVDSPNCGVMLDTFHMSIEEDNLGAAIRRAGDKLVHFHVGERNRKVPGMGTQPWDEIGQALRDVNYQGYVVMEPFVMPGGTVGREVNVWRELMTDTSEAALDADAARAVQFLRHVFER